MSEATTKEAFEKDFTKEYLDMLDNKKDVLISEYVYMAFTHGFSAGKKGAADLIKNAPNGTLVKQLITILEESE